MKKIILVAAITMIVIAMAGGAFAGSTTANVAVSAKVNGSCGNTSAGTFSLLTIIPSNVADQAFTVSSDAKAQCTKDFSTVSITATSLNGTASLVACTGSTTYLTGFAMKEPVSGNKINYSFACKSSITGIGFGTAGDGTHDVALGTAAKVLAADVQVADYASGNTYADTVTLTINY